eukprot:GEMP01003104.1.p1 GENE.GEMP01003104.1~~GEMP01003104.1.p1  ORF type:complete len:1209 (+),score=254.45 GEMP01003104.1:82-3708(+)
MEGSNLATSSKPPPPRVVLPFSAAHHRVTTRSSTSSNIILQDDACTPSASSTALCVLDVGCGTSHIAALPPSNLADDHPADSVFIVECCHVSQPAPSNGTISSSSREAPYPPPSLAMPSTPALAASAPAPPAPKRPPPMRNQASRYKAPPRVLMTSDEILRLPVASRPPGVPSFLYRKLPPGTITEPIFPPRPHLALAPEHLQGLPFAPVQTPFLAPALASLPPHMLESEVVREPRPEFRVCRNGLPRTGLTCSELMQTHPKPISYQLPPGRHGLNSIEWLFSRSDRFPIRKNARQEVEQQGHQQQPKHQQQPAQGQQPPQQQQPPQEQQQQQPAQGQQPPQHQQPPRGLLWERESPTFFVDTPRQDIIFKTPPPKCPAAVQRIPPRATRSVIPTLSPPAAPPAIQTSTHHVPRPASSPPVLAGRESFAKVALRRCPPTKAAPCGPDSLYRTAPPKQPVTRVPEPVTVLPCKSPMPHVLREKTKRLCQVEGRAAKALADGDRVLDPPVGQTDDEYRQWMSSHPHRRNAPDPALGVSRDFQARLLRTKSEIPAKMIECAHQALRVVSHHYPQVALRVESNFHDGDTQAAVKIGFCTSVLNRRSQVELALPISLANMWKHRQWAQFYIVDFDSTDGVSDYIKTNFPDAIRAGLLKLYHTRDMQHFHASVCKNTAHRMAIEDACDIVVNLDADNIVGPNFGLEILRAYREDEADAIHFYSSYTNDGTYGRIVCFASDFEFMRGYEEAMRPTAKQDADLLARLDMLGRCIVGQSMWANHSWKQCGVDQPKVAAIPNQKSDTIKNVSPEYVGMSWAAMNKRNGDMVSKLRAKGKIVRNHVRSEYPYFGCVNVTLQTVPPLPPARMSSRPLVSIPEVPAEASSSSMEGAENRQAEREEAPTMTAGKNGPETPLGDHQAAHHPQAQSTSSAQQPKHTEAEGEPSTQEVVHPAVPRASTQEPKCLEFQSASSTRGAKQPESVSELSNDQPAKAAVPQALTPGVQSSHRKTGQVHQGAKSESAHQERTFWTKPDERDTSGDWCRNWLPSRQEESNNWHNTKSYYDNTTYDGAGKSATWGQNDKHAAESWQHTAANYDSKWKAPTESPMADSENVKNEEENGWYARSTGVKTDDYRNFSRWWANNNSERKDDAHTWSANGWKSSGGWQSRNPKGGKTGSGWGREYEGGRKNAADKKNYTSWEWWERSSGSQKDENKTY